MGAKKLTNSEIVEILNASDGSSTPEPFSDTGSEYFCSNLGSTSDESLSNAVGELEIIEDDDDEPIITSESENDEDWNDLDFEPDVFEFIGEEGIKVPLDSNVSSENIFSLFFDESLLSKITDWVNLRAAAHLQSGNLKPKSNLLKWKPLRITELKRFLGLCIIMGNVHMPNLHYWSKNEMYHHPIFGKIMSRNRFENILRCLCFYNNETNDTSHRLHKISNVSDHILDNIKKVYYPAQHLALDEAMMLWRGRLSFRQYIPNKRHKYGIKFYELCTPDGFLLNMLIYSGQNTVQPRVEGHAFGVVEELMKDYVGKGHILYMDNYYNSVILAEHLFEQRTHLCGTLRANRKQNPSDVITKKLKKNETIWRRRNNITVQKWKDKRDVLMISSLHKAEMIEYQNKRGITSQKPIMVADYIKHMSGVDRNDQMTSYYSTPRKSLRWYIKVFFHLLDISVWNSNWLLNKHKGSKTSYLSFREMLAISLLNSQDLSDVSCSSRSDPSSSYSQKKTSTKEKTLQHYAIRTDKRKKCRQCSKEKKRTDTHFICDTCVDTKGQTIGLCVAPCFKMWHNSTG